MCSFGIRCGGYKPEHLPALRAARVEYRGIYAPMRRAELVAIMVRVTGNDPAFYRARTKASLVDYLTSRDVEITADRLGAWDRPACEGARLAH